MSVNVGSEFPIKQADLERHFGTANTILRSVTHRPTKDLDALLTDRGSAPRPSGLIFGSGQGPSAQNVSVLKTAQAVNKDDDLMDENINAALNTVRAGIQIGLHIGSLFAKSSGLEALKNNPKADEKRYTNLMAAQAFITLFVTAYYVTWKLAAQKAEELTDVKVDFLGIPEPLSLSGQTTAFGSALFHYDAYLKRVQNGLEFLKITQLYFRAILDDLKMQAKAFEADAGTFTDKSYRLERTTFAVNGFHAEVHGGLPSAEFKRVDLNEVVGNFEAKRLADRLTQYLIAYDLDREMNPMIELGAFPNVALFKGKPGTGKTLIMGGMLTQASDYCMNLGLPFRAHPMPNTIVSTFQGGSAENMQNWMDALKNRSELVIAPIDDAENVFESRTRQGVSAGVKEVIGTFLVNTEGASAIIRGNTIIVIATNIPDQLDLAVLSRVQMRADVDGAARPEDWMDQTYLWTKRMDGWGVGFVNLAPPKDYKFLSAQRLLRQEDTKKLAANVSFVDERLGQIHVRLLKEGVKPDGFAYYGKLFTEALKSFPTVSSRDMRNIQTAVMTRFFDFDFPKEWLTERERFVAKPYDEKRGMILEVAKANLGKLTFAQVLFEETAKYLNVTVSILDGGINRRIEERAADIRIDNEARRRLANGEVRV